MTTPKPAFHRHPCPCCGYPTLTELAAYEICVLCNWEDDGQDDESADEVWGGPNSDYSLSEAQKNFLKYRVMYSPEGDQRLTGNDTPLEFETKGQLIAAFEKLAGASLADRQHLTEEVARLESVLHAEATRQIKTYETAHRHAPDAVHNKASFIRFVEALIEDRQRAEELERADPARYRMGGANNWQNGSISSFLEAALAGALAQKDWGNDQAGPSWRDLAVLLYLGKIYE